MVSELHVKTKFILWHCILCSVLFLMNLLICPTSVLLLHCHFVPHFLILPKFLFWISLFAFPTNHFFLLSYNYITPFCPQFLFSYPKRTSSMASSSKNNLPSNLTTISFKLITTIITSGEMPWFHCSKHMNCSNQSIPPLIEKIIVTKDKQTIEIGNPKYRKWMIHDQSSLKCILTGVDVDVAVQLLECLCSRSMVKTFQPLCF